MGEAAAEVRRLIADEIGQEAAAPFRALAEAVRRRHDPAGLGVLFYGSCLRSGEDRDHVADLYLIVERYAAAYRNPLLALANRVLPPNVATVTSWNTGFERPPATTSGCAMWSARCWMPGGG